MALMCALGPTPCSGKQHPAALCFLCERGARDRQPGGSPELGAVRRQGHRFEGAMQRAGFHLEGVFEE